MKKIQEIDWEQVDNESAVCLQKCLNFEKDLKRIRQQNKGLEQQNKDVNEFCKTNNIPTHTLKLKK